MKKFFVLLLAMYCGGAFAVNPESEIGREFMSSAMEECVDGMIEEDVGLGVASEYCKCILTKAVTELSVEQITEYYEHGREIEKLMEKSAKDCLGILLNDSESSAKKQIVTVATQQCVESAMETGAGLGVASEYCKCAISKVFDNLTNEQIFEYYNHGREIENLMTDASKDCAKMLWE